MAMNKTREREKQKTSGVDDKLSVPASVPILSQGQLFAVVCVTSLLVLLAGIRLASPSQADNMAGRLETSDAKVMDIDTEDMPCNIRAVDANELPLHEIAMALRGKNEPVLIRNAMDVGKLRHLDAVVAQHSEMELEVVHGGPGFEWAARLPRSDFRSFFHAGGKPTGKPARLVRLSLGSFVAAMRNGTATADSYCFHEVVRGSPLLLGLPALTTLDEMVLIARHAPAEWDDDRRRKALAATELRGALHGAAYVAMGVDQSGGTFHAHTDALLGLLSGSKRWFISPDRRHPPLTKSERLYGRVRHLLRKVRTEVTYPTRQLDM
jgi:hypothetical protein